MCQSPRRAYPRKFVLRNLYCFFSMFQHITKIDLVTLSIPFLILRYHSGAPTLIIVLVRQTISVNGILIGFKDISAAVFGSGVKNFRKCGM